jgi:hypothetical protein
MRVPSSDARPDPARFSPGVVGLASREPPLQERLCTRQRLASAIQLPRILRAQWSLDRGILRIQGSVTESSPYTYLTTWRLPEDAAEMMSEKALVVPSELAQETTDAFLLAAADHLIQLWVSAIDKPELLPKELEYESTKVESDHIVDLIVSRLMFAYGGVVGGLMLRYGSRYPIEVPGITDFGKRGGLPFEPRTRSSETLATRPGRTALVSYLYLRAVSFSWQSMAARLMSREPSSAYIAAVGEHEMHEAWSDLIYFRALLPSKDPLQIVIHIAMSDLELKRGSLLRHLGGVELEAWRVRGFRESVSYTSELVDELDGVARRSPFMRAHLGEKYLARLFESQLAVVFESLGFTVLLTRVGERRADLLCIGGDATQPFSFILEAKSSARGYGLPAKDERALREYVHDVRAHLATHAPPLRFLLIVGGAPARTLSGKLERLQADIQLPTRFITAQSVAELRKKLPGTVYHERFVEMILGGSCVLPDSFALSVLEDHERLRALQEEHLRYALTSSTKVAR